MSPAPWARKACQAQCPWTNWADGPLRNGWQLKSACAFSFANFCARAPAWSADNEVARGAVLLHPSSASARRTKYRVFTVLKSDVRLCSHWCSVAMGDGIVEDDCQRQRPKSCMRRGHGDVRAWSVEAYKRLDCVIFLGPTLSTAFLAAAPAPHRFSTKQRIDLLHPRRHRVVHRGVRLLERRQQPPHLVRGSIGG